MKAVYFMNLPGRAETEEKKHVICTVGPKGKGRRGGRIERRGDEMKTRKGLLRFVLALAVAVGLFGSVSVSAANTTYDSATTISVNSSKTDNLTDDSDVNWYKFTLSSSGYIYLSFTHDYIESGSTYWRAYLYDSGQNELTNYWFAGNTTSYTQGKIGLSAGTYYIKITNYYYDDANYTLKVNYTSSSAWETEFNEEYTTADKISANSTVYGSLMDDSDVDWYKFTLSSAGYISLTFKHDYVESGSTYWRAYLYDSGQNELTNYWFAGNTTSYTQGKIGLSAGTYYIKITNYYYDDANYNLKVNYTTSSTWETEFNEEYTTADKISANSTVYGSLMDDSDVDWYKFTLSSAGYISLTFKHDYVESGSTYWRAYLYDSGQNELTNYWFAGDTTSYTQGNIGLSAGTYYIKITNYYYDDANYKLKVNYTSSSAWETEFNDSYSTADSISTGTAVKGSLMDDSDVDWYKFKLTAKKSLAFKFTHTALSSGSTYWKAYVYNADMTQLYEFSYAGDTKSSIEYFTLSKGTYYVKVTNYYYDDGNYSLKVMARKSLSSATVTLSKTTYTYSGSARKPSVTVKLGSKTLTKGTDYTVTYKSNKSIGTATVTVKGIGAYKGSVSKTYKIKPKQATISSAKSSAAKKITVKWKKVSGSVTKYQIRYRYKTSSGYSSWKKVTVSSSSLKKTLTGLKSGKKYQIQVRAYKTVSGENYVGSWSKTKTVTVK